MEYKRVSIVLDKTEYQALSTMAQAEFRQPRSQLRFLLLDAARKLGLLPTDERPSSPAEKEEYARAR